MVLPVECYIEPRFRPLLHSSPKEPPWSPGQTDVPGLFFLPASFDHEEHEESCIH